MFQVLRDAEHRNMKCLWTSSHKKSKIFLPKLSDFFIIHKGGREAEKPFRAITFLITESPLKAIKSSPVW